MKDIYERWWLVKYLFHRYLMKSYTIHLIRHGIAEGNLLGQYIGRTDSPLADEGRKACKRSRKHMHILPHRFFIVAL